MNFFERFVEVVFLLLISWEVTMAEVLITICTLVFTKGR